MTALPSTYSLRRRLATIAFPQRHDDEAPTPVIWLIHALLWAGILFAAWQLNHRSGLERWLRSPWPLLHHAWLPVLALLLYAFGWLTVGLWHALRRSAPASVFRDIEAIWNGAWGRIAETHHNAVDVPLFLILGPYTPELKTLLDAIGAAAVLPRSAAPLHVFAHAEAIFVVCGQVSLLGTQGRRAPSAGDRADRDDETSARLHQFCQLLARDRPGQRTLQGIILVAPLPALADDEQTHSVLASCQEDLQVVRHATGLECPLYLAISGLNGLPRGAADGWFRRFPLMPDCEPEEVSEVLKKGVDQLCSEKILPLVRRQMQLAPDTPGSLTETLRENIQQYHLLAAAHSWKARLCQLATEGTWNDFAEPGLVAGCYFLPGLPHHESHVVQALWLDLLSHQQTVTWTPESCAERTRQRQMTRRGYGLVLAGWLGIAAVTVFALAYRL